MTAIVTANNSSPVRFRNAPGGQIIAEIPQGTKVDIIGTEGDWCKIEYNGKTGYMMSKFLSKGNSQLTTLKNKLKEVLQILDTLED